MSEKIRKSNFKVTRRGAPVGNSTPKNIYEFIIVWVNELSKQFITSSFYILTECKNANGGSAKFFQQLYIDTY